MHGSYPGAPHEQRSCRLPSARWSVQVLRGVLRSVVRALLPDPEQLGGFKQGRRIRG